MISWFDIGYTILNIIVAYYCFEKYFSSRKKPFQLCGLGFTCLIISGFLWVLTIFPRLDGIFAVYGYIRFGLYAAFAFLVIRAFELFSSGDTRSNQ